MSPRARNSYSNCILLCPTCHTLADKNWSDYPLDLLRRFKARHESWVAESLRADSAHIGPSAQFYRRLLKRVERYLHLEKWPWLIDRLERDMLPDDAMFDQRKIAAISVGTLWPRTRPKLEKAIRATLAAWSEYVNHFMTFSDPSRLGNFFVCERPYEGAPPQFISEFDTKGEAWSKRNSRDLQNYIAHLNGLVDIVRAELDPAYRQDDGYFLISDDKQVAAPRHPSEEEGPGTPLVPHRAQKVPTDSAEEA